MLGQKVFSYWTGDDQSGIEDFVTEWRSQFPNFRVFGDADVRPLIRRYFPEHLDLFDNILIPTAKSDVALLLLLFEYGGLYVDCHCGIRNAREVNSLLSLLVEYDAIFVDRRLWQEPRPLDQHLIINSMIFSRRRFSLLRRLCHQALVNLSRQRDAERRNGFSPYNIWSLSGPGLVTAMLFETASDNRDVRIGYEGRVQVIREEVAPIARDRHRSYSIPGLHWSERQKTECLFGGKALAVGDAAESPFDAAAPTSEWPDLLKALVDTSRRAFGWQCRHNPHTINYPWTASRLAGLSPGSRLLDIASGVSPLPVWLAESEMFVDCVDNSHIIRKLPADDAWNEWGFFDYGAVHQNLSAYHCSIADFSPWKEYDAIYSVCSIAHFPSGLREQTLENCWAWLKAGGRLVICIDLIPGTDTLWNLGGSEETPEQHGTYGDVERQATQLGFRITESRVMRAVQHSRTDLYFLVAEKP